MKRFIFKSDQIVEAENERDAWEKFADDSLDFSANATCYELDHGAWNKEGLK